MTVKLNLTIDETIVAKTKRYAARKKTTVSKMVQELLRKQLLMEDENKNKRDFVKRTAGVIKIKDVNIEQKRGQYLKEKYGI